MYVEDDDSAKPGTLKWSAINFSRRNKKSGADELLVFKPRKNRVL